MPKTIESLIDQLPPHLQERTRPVTADTSPLDGPDRFILYWMSTAMRAEENPALDVAVHMANELGCPLLIYQGLSQRYKYASDRHHRFILEGVHDVQQAFTETGYQYVFHLERPSKDQKHLAQLSQRAALVVVEDMPTAPIANFRRGLQASSSFEGQRVPLIAVDTACVVPPLLVGKAYDRAYAYRDKTRKLYEERTTRIWPKVEPSFPRNEIYPGFQTQHVELDQLPAMIAQCDIDHTIPPVYDTVGGSEAGYRRWASFLERGLRTYHRKRNDPLQDGVSRMSAYLHYGMVSPFRLAREAATSGQAGAEKYLDELLIWRELAYCFCFHRKKFARWSALPQWAQATLEAHAQDPRDRIYSWEQLARGKTNDRLWNATQRSLVLHGELHNNVRMTWAKNVLQWVASPQDALRVLIDLNHRFALDGRDPASYGGILWAFGQFDRPFTPERPILGTVRDRPTEQHARRLDIDGYHQQIEQLRHSAPRVAIIGAGLSGAIAARTLREQGLSVKIFEKSRGYGGRMATRKHSDEIALDHGAQYFTAYSDQFRRHVQSWIQQGWVSAWDAKIVAYDRPQDPQPVSGQTTRYVAVPSMSSLAAYLAEDTPISFENRIARLEPQGEQVRLFNSNGDDEGLFNYVVSSLPAPQAIDLLGHFPDLTAELTEVAFRPCWCVMLAFDEPLSSQAANESDRRLDAAFVNIGPLRWIACNSSKPGRDKSTDTWVLHASPKWSESHLDASKEDVATALTQALWELTGFSPKKPAIEVAHRWRYSISEPRDSQRIYMDPSERVLACGDWAGGPRVEGAFLSGCAAAGRILGMLEPKLQQPAGQMSLF